MKPDVKQINDLRKKITLALGQSDLSFADIGQLSGVDQSQVGRICRGNFKTFSHNVVKICDVLEVPIPRLGERPTSPNLELAKARSSMLRLWDQTPEGAKLIQRLLDAVADLQDARNESSNDA